LDDDAKPEAAELQVGQAQVVRKSEHAGGDLATDAQRAASERRATCPECGQSADHADDCVLRPVQRYEDYLRELKANRPEEYWLGRFDYLSDYQK